MKFAAADQRYLTERETVSKEFGQRELFEVIDQWPLYVGIGNLGRFMAIADILRSTLSVPGHVAEFGSWKGANVMFLTKLLRIYDPHGSKVVHCFESFQGLTNFGNKDVDEEKWRGTYKGNREVIDAFVELYELQDELVIHQGLVEDTLVPTLAADQGVTFSLVYCDVDTYEPTKIILDNMHPRLAKGGVFVFDEWNFADWPGETRAANEFLAKHSDYYLAEHIPNTRQPTMLLRKIRA